MEKNCNHECAKCATRGEPEKDMRRRIIALTGKDQSALELIQNSMANLTNIFKVEKINSKNTSTDDFLDRIIKGDIIEASCDNNYIITGTSKQTIEPGFLYIGIYTPHQLSNLLENKDPNLEILPIEIELNNEEHLANLIKRNKEDVYQACKEYIKIEETYEGDEFLDGEVCLWKYYKSMNTLSTDYGSCLFFKQIKEFNQMYNLITDLDNFI